MKRGEVENEKDGDLTTSTRTKESLPKFIPHKVEGEWTVSSGEAYKKIMALFGTKDRDAFNLFMNQLVPATGYVDKKDHGQAVNQLIPLLSAINPKNELEGMLASQMISVHFASIEMMRRAMKPGKRIEGVNDNINRATKLMRTFIAQMEALNKHRGKGKQKITVEHVTVNSGGQAIVGNIDKGVEGSGRKK